MEHPKVTHRSLIPKGMCPSLVMKQMLTFGLGEEIHDARTEPGDGYYWCLRTCKNIGPDDELVLPSQCVAGRKCYEGIES